MRSFSFAILALTSCGPTSERPLVSAAPDAAIEPTPDAPAVVEPMDAPGTCGTAPPPATCEKLEFGFSTQQACTIEILPGQVVDGEGYITVNNETHRVLTLNRLGSGHLIGWCDATTTRELLENQNLVQYLGQSAAPRVASFGPSVLCQPGANPSSIYSTQATYLGDKLPAQYAGNPGALATDWDVVVFCGMYEWATDWSTTLQPYVACHGKGVLTVMDYRQGGANTADFTHVNALVAPAGFAFEPVSIDWASGSGAFNQCVPGVFL